MELKGEIMEKAQKETQEEMCEGAQRKRLEEVHLWTTATHGGIHAGEDTAPKGVLWSVEDSH